MAKIKLDENVIKRLKEPIYHVWSQIAPDAEGLVEDNLQAMEICLDADRLILVADDKESYDYFHRVMDDHGYGKTLKFLAKHIHLY
jgi:hypothetical protein